MKEEGDIDEEFLAADFSTINEEGDIDEEFLAAVKKLHLRGTRLQV